MQKNLFLGVAAAALVMFSVAPRAAAQDADQPGDATTQARLENSVESDLTAGDTDWYRLSVERGMRYNLALAGLPDAEGATVDPILVIYDAQGNQVAFNDDANESLNSALRYIPQQSGEVFVEARAFSETASGRYRLGVSIDQAPADDVANDTTTRTRVSPGRSANNALQYEGDVDVFRLSARTGNRYRVTLSGTGGENGLGDPMLRVTDRDGNELASNDDTEGSLNSALEFVPQANGEVFIEARSYADASQGAYTLNVATERLPNDGTPGSRSTSRSIRPGQTVNAALDFAGDRDWYRARLTEGQSYRFTLQGDGGEPLGDPLLRLYNNPGEEIAADDDGGEGFNAYLEFTAPSSGTYFIEARGFGEEETGGYALRAVAGDIPADATTDAGLAADGDYRDGMLAPAGDRDWYRVDLQDGQSIRVGLTGNGDPSGLQDPFLAIYTADGVQVGMDDDGGEGLNAWLEYEAATAGAHYIEVRGFTEDASGAYSLNLMGGEIGAAPEAAEYLTLNDEGRASSINADGDVDWFAVELAEGRTHRFYLDTAEENGLADPYLRLVDAQGNEVAADDDGGAGFNSYITYAPTVGGTYFAAVSSYGDTGAGRYRLRVSDFDVPGQIYTDENLNAAEDERASRIDIPGDLDTYRVSLEQGVRYRIEISRNGEHGLASPHVAVLDSEGAAVAGRAGTRVTFTPEASGEFYIQASGQRGSTGGYQVRIVRQ